VEDTSRDKILHLMLGRRDAPDIRLAGYPAR
jgi:hypothetical protein